MTLVIDSEVLEQDDLTNGVNNAYGGYATAAGESDSIEVEEGGDSYSYVSDTATATATAARRSPSPPAKQKKLLHGVNSLCKSFLRF